MLRQEAPISRYVRLLVFNILCQCTPQKDQWGSKGYIEIQRFIVQLGQSILADLSRACNLKTEVRKLTLPITWGGNFCWPHHWAKFNKYIRYHTNFILFMINGLKYILCLDFKTLCATTHGDLWKTCLTTFLLFIAFGMGVEICFQVHTFNIFWIQEHWNVIKSTWDFVCFFAVTLSNFVCDNIIKYIECFLNKLQNLWGMLFALTGNRGITLLWQNKMNKVLPRSI